MSGSGRYAPDRCMTVKRQLSRGFRTLCPGFSISQNLRPLPREQRTIETRYFRVDRRRLSAQKWSFKLRRFPSQPAQQTKCRTEQPGGGWNRNHGYRKAIHGSAAGFSLGRLSGAARCEHSYRRVRVTNADPFSRHRARAQDFPVQQSNKVTTGTTGADRSTCQPPSFMPILSI
jgi:hypothetical protein